MSTPETELRYVIREAHTALRAAFKEALADLDLTPVQNTVLHLITEAPGSSSAELARRTHVTPQTMHKLVAELQQRELLILKPRPGHGRTLNCELTPLGDELRAVANARLQQVDDRMTAGLDENQRQQLHDLLQHCIGNLTRPTGEHR